MPEPRQELETSLRALTTEIGRRRRQGLPVDDLIEQHGRLTGEMEGGADRRQVARREYRVDEIEDFASDDTLSGPWGELFLASKPYSPYMSREWQRAWCLTYGRRDPTRLLTVSESPSGRLVGLLPLSHRRGNVLTPFRHVAICGTQPGTVLYTHPLIAPDVDRDAVAALLVQSLKRSRVPLIGGFWDSDDPGARALASALEGSWFRILREPLPAARWDTLPGTFEEFVRQLPARTRRNRIRHYARQGWLEDGEFVLETYEDPDAILPRLPIMRQLSDAKYGLGSVWRRHPLVDFLSECVRRSDAVKPVLWMLMHGKAPAAAMLAWLWERRCFVSALAYDRNDEHFEPGHVVISRAVADLIRRGTELIDFGPGMAYKAYYFRRQRPFVRLLASPRGASADRALAAMFLLRPSVAAIWRAREAVWRGLSKLRRGE